MSAQPHAPHPLERMDAAVRSAGVGVWLNALPLGDLVWNDNTKAHFHVARDVQPTLALFYERIHADDRERVRQAIARAIDARRPFDEVYRTVGPGGAQKWVHAVGRVAFDAADGSPKQFDGITLDITQAVTAQQQLRDFADSAPAILWVTETDGLCSFLSRAWTAYTGQPEAAGLGFGWLEMVHPDDRPNAETAFRNATAGHAPFALEHRLRRADGSWAWVIDAGRPRFGATGEFLGFAGSVTDIHDRRTAEEGLRRSSQRYSRLLESIDQGFCVIEILLDAQGRPADYRFLEMNEVFERQTGLHEPVGHTARELVPGLEEFWFQTYGNVALTQEAVRFTHGSQAMGRWFDVFASPVGEPGERHVAILFQDVSRRVEQERLLRESEERYRGFLASSTEGIWRMEFQPPVDASLPIDEQVDAVFERGRFAECNGVFARMYRLDSPARVVGRGLDIIASRSDPRARSVLRDLIQAGYRSAEGEYMEPGRTGRPSWFAYNLSGVVENGFLVRAWGTQRNITDRKLAQAALVEADLRKDEFLATLAHELRNPLAPIRTAAELLRRAGLHDARQVRHAEMIGRQVTHLARMIDDLMDVSRVTRGKLALQVAPLTLDDVVRAAADNAQAVLQAGSHPLALAMPGEPVHLQGDEVRLVQVFLNLLTNAARYSAHGSPVKVTLATEGAQAVVRVRDEGIGIAPEQLPRVFELFYQGGLGLKRTSGGLGIGLSLVQQLTALHGGSVQAFSEGLGKGSEFVVRLPLTAAAVGDGDGDRDRDAAGAAPAPVAVLRMQPRRLLIVDDNRDAADTMSEVLRGLGHEVTTAYDGVEGLAQAQAVRPEVAVLDLGMPRLDGYGMCRALRASDWGRTMAVIALSGWGQVSDVQRGQQAGFDGHLVKPISPDALVQAIEQALASPKTGAGGAPA